MAVTALWYGLALKDQWGTTAADRVDFITDTMKVMLATNAYTADQDTNSYMTTGTTGASASEVSSSGYVAGGVAMTGKALTYTAGTNVVKFDADDDTWATVTFTTRWAVVYKSTGTSTTSHVFSYVNMGADNTISAGNFTIQWDPAGIATITAA